MADPATNTRDKLKKLVERLRAIAVMPVIVIDESAHAAPLAAALGDGGLPCAEVTFRTDGAEETIRRMVAARPDLLVGAGTVLTRDQVSAAERAGAAFVVAPGFNRGVVDYCLERDMPVFPGVCTPTEIEAALETGVRLMKFFPAEPAGGLRYLKAIAQPYEMVEFIPTGGLNRENFASYLAFDRVVACGGSWIAPRDWIASGAFERIRAEAAATVRAVRVARVNSEARPAR
jgi:2-dehydro-3-deoxyphosphogluconate aldolase/(4S)-4-hydroxy-2-oxoglutarate aldolase